MKEQNKLLRRITINKDICNGKPTIRNKRYPVETILSYLAGGDTVESLLKEFPDLEKDDILACIEFATTMIISKSVHITV